MYVSTFLSTFSLRNDAFSSPLPLFPLFDLVRSFHPATLIDGPRLPVTLPANNHHRRVLHFFHLLSSSPLFIAAFSQNLEPVYMAFDLTSTPLHHSILNALIQQNIRDLIIAYTATKLSPSRGALPTNTNLFILLLETSSTKFVFGARAV